MLTATCGKWHYMKQQKKMFNSYLHCIIYSQQSVLLINVAV